MKLLEAVNQVALLLEELTPPDQKRVLNLCLELGDQLHADLDDVEAPPPKAKKAKKKAITVSEVEEGSATAEVVQAVKHGACTPRAVAEVLGIQYSAASARLRKAFKQGLVTSPQRGTYEVV